MANYWLMKSEPFKYSWDDLVAEEEGTWDGVRNYQARNMIRDDMAVGDMAFFYHSSCKVPGIVGTMKIVTDAYPDHTAFDPAAHYHDPKSDPDNPRWVMVDVEFVAKFATVVPLALLQETPGLEDMMVTKRGMRLSIQPVSAEEWAIVNRLGNELTPDAVAKFLTAKKAKKNAGTAAKTKKKKTAVKKKLTAAKKKKKTAAKKS